MTEHQPPDRKPTVYPKVDRSGFTRDGCIGGCGKKPTKAYRCREHQHGATNTHCRHGVEFSRLCGGCLNEFKVKIRPEHLPSIVWP